MRSHRGGSSPGRTGSRSHMYRTEPQNHSLQLTSTEYLIQMIKYGKFVDPGDEEQTSHRTSCAPADPIRDREIRVKRQQTVQRHKSFLFWAISCSVRGFRQKAVYWGLFGSTNFPSRGVHLFPPPLLSKSKPLMCRPLCEMDGVSMTCTVVRPTVGDFKTRKQGFRLWR